MRPKLKKGKDLQASTDNLSRLLTSPRTHNKSERTLTSPRDSLRTTKTGEKDKPEELSQSDTKKAAVSALAPERKPHPETPADQPSPTTPHTPPKPPSLIPAALLSRPSPVTVKVNLLSLLSLSGSKDANSQRLDVHDGEAIEDLGAVAMQMLQAEGDAMHLSTEEMDRLLQELREGSERPADVFRVLKQVETMDRPRLTTVLEALKQIEGFWELAMDLAEKNLFKYQVSVGYRITCRKSC